MSWKPNQRFVAPPGFSSTRPHRISDEYPVSAATLYDAFRAAALAEPRVSVVEEDRERLRLELCQRSALFRFPDDISAEIIPLDERRASLAVYSRARLGIWDLGVNRRRVARWLAALAGRVRRGTGERGEELGRNAP